MVLAPDGKTLYVANGITGTITPIDLRTSAPETPIYGYAIIDLAIAPNGSRLFYLDGIHGTLVPIELPSGHRDAPIPVGGTPQAVAIDPSGQHAYVAIAEGDRLVSVDLKKDEVQQRITLPGQPHAIAVLTSDQLFVAVYGVYGGNEIEPVETSGPTIGPPINVVSLGSSDGLAISRRHDALYVADGGNSEATPISLATLKSRAPVKVGPSPDSVAITPNGKELLVLCDSSVYPVPL